MRHALIFLLTFLLLIFLTIGIGIENENAEHQDQNLYNSYNPSLPTFSRIEAGNSHTQIPDNHLYTDNDVDKNFNLLDGNGNGIGGYQNLNELGHIGGFNQFFQNGDYDEYDNYYEDKNSVGTNSKDHQFICTALAAFLKKLKGIKSFLLLIVKLVKLVKSLKIISLFKGIFDVVFWPVILLSIIFKFLFLIALLFIPIPIITTTVTSSKSFYPTFTTSAADSNLKDLMITERILKSVNDDCVKRIFCEIATGIKYKDRYRNNQVTHQYQSARNLKFKPVIEGHSRKSSKNSSKSGIWENCTRYQCKIHF